MKLPRLRTILLAPVVVFAGFYLVGVIANLLDDRQVQPLSKAGSRSTEKIAVFGASCTAGDGILKAALGQPQRMTPSGPVVPARKRPRGPVRDG